MPIHSLLQRKKATPTIPDRAGAVDSLDDVIASGVLENDVLYGNLLPEYAHLVVSVQQELAIRSPKRCKALTVPKESFPRDSPFYRALRFGDELV